nr:hypothetical protein BaRGS_032683 [Batillaria attramentaria]
MQACRGGQLDPGQQVKVIHSPEEPMDEVDAAGEQEVIVSLPPCFKDFLIMYATPPGSWFVQALCAVLEHSDGSSNILKLLTSVTRLVAQEYLSRTPGSTETDLKKQTPCIYSMLTKDLFLKVADKKGEILTWG